MSDGRWAGDLVEGTALEQLVLEGTPKAAEAEPPGTRRRPAKDARARLFARLARRARRLSFLPEGQTG